MASANEEQKVRVCEEISEDRDVTGSFVQEDFKENVEAYFHSFTGILSKDVKKEISIIGGENNRVVEAEINFIHHHHPEDTTKNIEAELNKHMEDVKQSLQTLYSSEVAWVKPMGSLVDLELEPEDFYVEMEMEELSRSGKLPKNGSVSLNDILLPETGHGVPPKRILIRGEAGMGKTTLCLKIAYDWSVGKMDNFARDFRILIVFRLRDLLDTDSPEKGLAHFCKVNSSSEVDEEFALRALKENAQKILIILDGFDELTSRKRKQFVNFLKLKTNASQTVFRNSTIIVTSRTTENADILQLFQRHFRIVGLTPESTRKIVKTMFPFNTIRQQEVLSRLNKYLLKFTTKMTPFALYLICYLYQNKEVREIETPSIVIKDVVLLMGRKWNDRSESSMDETTMMKLFHKLGEFFLNKILDLKISFPKKDVEEMFENEMERRFVLECGVLQPLKSLSRSWERANWIEPIHKLFADYLTTSYLQNEFDSQDTTVEKVSFVLRALRPPRVQLYVRSPNETILFTSPKKTVGVLFMTTWNPLEDVAMEDVLKNGKFWFNDDEFCQRYREEFDNQMNHLGYVEMFFNNEKENVGYSGSGMVLSEHFVGKDLLSLILENELVSNDFCIGALFRHFPQQVKETTILALNVRVDGQVAWRVRTYFVGLDFKTEEWFYHKEKDNVVLEQEFCYRIGNP